ncbi:MAG TPA: riboflavin synthase [Thermoplasmata archaeon]|nr:riboflavin synthase [Thermoplasmata archaeon]
MTKARGRRIGVVDTTFARFDMGAAAVDELRKASKPSDRLRIDRVVVPGIKDLPVAAKNLLDAGCDLVIACGMVGGAEVDRQCALVADIGLQQAQLLAGKPILGVAVYEQEAKDERELAWLMDRRTREHAANAYQMLYRPEALLAKAGTGQRQGFADAGPIRLEG